MKNSRARTPVLFESLEARQMLAADHSLGVGRFNDAAFSSNGTLHVAWYDPTGQDLKYAARASNGTWSSTVTLDSAGDVGTYVSLGISGDGNPVAVYYDATNADLKGAYLDGGTWHTQAIDSTGRVGMYPSIAFDSGGVPSVTYYDRTHGDLKMASYVLSSSSWALSVVDSTSDSGRYSSLAMNPNTGRWAVGYEQTTGGLFRYAQRGSSGWSVATVDDTQIGGGYVSLNFDDKDRPVMSYYDAYNADLKAAVLKTTWNVMTVASKGSVGLYSNLLVDQTGGYIYYYNRSANVVGRATALDGDAWSYANVKSGGGTHVTAVSSGSARSLVWLNTTTGQLIVSDGV